MKNYTKDAAALKRRDFINDSIRKAEKAQLAKIAAADSAQSKKKLLTAKKTKPISSRKIVSL
jgi:hypothetical protein